MVHFFLRRNELIEIHRMMEEKKKIWKRIGRCWMLIFWSALFDWRNNLIKSNWWKIIFNRYQHMNWCILMLRFRYPTNWLCLIWFNWICILFYRITLNTKLWWLIQQTKHSTKTQEKKKEKTERMWKGHQATHKCISLNIKFSRPWCDAIAPGRFGIWYLPMIVKREQCLCCHQILWPFLNERNSCELHSHDVKRQRCFHVYFSHSKRTLFVYRASLITLGLVLVFGMRSSFISWKRDWKCSDDDIVCIHLKSDTYSSKRANR